MARTPLLRSLQKLFLEFKEADRQGLPLEAIREQQALKVPVTRRRFLAGAAGAGAGLLALGDPKIARATQSQPDVAIVGGGIAGLTCALRLLDRNIESTVYEASGRSGGRMFTNSGYWQQGQISEWGGELIDTGHRTVRRLAHRFDLPLDDLLAAEPNGTQDTYRFFGNYYPKSQADADFGPVYDAVTADEADAPFPTLYDSYTAAGQALSQMSVHDWIETRVPGGHASPLGQLLDVAYAIEYGADTTDQAALNLIYLLAYQPRANRLAVFGESDERFHIRGGNQQLPERMADALGVGSRVKHGWSLVRIVQTAGSRYRLTFDRGSTTTDVVVDYVVLAIPFTVLREIDFSAAGFDPLKTQAINELGRGRNGKLNIQFNQRLWNTNGPWPGRGNGASYADTGYQASWEATRAQSGSKGILVLYSGGSVTGAAHATTPFARANNSGVAADVTEGLARVEPVFPGLSALYNGKATQSLPHLSNFFKCSYAYYRRNQYTQFAGYEGARQGGVLFCGEHTSTEFQGFMEGGASEGRRAARELANLIRGHDDADLL